MTPQNTVDLKGNFDSHPFAELLAEIAQAKLSGSLRLARGEKKTIVYIRGGEVVYAVSNARTFRLFTVLLESGKIDSSVIKSFPNFASDIEFAASLVQQGVLTREAIDAAAVTQIKQVLIDALVWPAAEWLFSPLARLRDGLVYDADIYNVLIEYGRCIPPEKIIERFKSVDEAFAPTNVPIIGFKLEKHESEFLPIFGDREMTVDQLKSRCGLPESAMYQTLYVLWLGGILKRQNWNAAFSAPRLDHIRTAKMSLIKGQSNTPLAPANGKSPDATAEPPVIPKTPRIIVADITLEEYLKRVEGCETYYDIMGVAKTAPAAEIKASYLMMAKLFHPDRYHRETGSLLRRIQIAFTDLAHAYETLKESDSRETYDYKMLKQLEAREKRRAEGIPESADNEHLKSESGAESFEAGLNYLMDEDYGPAATQFARAVHASPQNATYHAYYGQALSFLEKFQHKAEAEMQEAVRLDPKSAKIRMTLVQFFIDRKMAKRAEGELNRFLQIAPENKEAQELLAKLQQTGA